MKACASGSLSIVMDLIDSYRNVIDAFTHSKVGKIRIILVCGCMHDLLLSVDKLQSRLLMKTVSRKFPN